MPRPAGGSAPRFREEVLNVRLADLLSKRGSLAIPETIEATSHGRRLPDVVIGNLHGLRIIIEGKVGGTQHAQDQVELDASGRVEQGLASICIAVLYPPELREVPSTGLESEMARARLRFRVYSEDSSGEWNEGTIDNVGEVLRRAYEGLAREDLVEKAAEVLDAALHEAAGKFMRIGSAPARFRAALGIEELPTKEGTSSEDDD